MSKATSRAVKGHIGVQTICISLRNLSINKDSISIEATGVERMPGNRSNSLNSAGKQSVKATADSRSILNTEQVKDVASNRSRFDLEA